MQVMRLLIRRFFLFGHLEEPKANRLADLFMQSGFTYNANETTMATYGEWEDLCVTQWSRHLSRELGIAEGNYQIIAELSLPSPEERLHCRLELTFTQSAPQAAVQFGLCQPRG